MTPSEKIQKLIDEAVARRGKYLEEVYIWDDDTFSLAIRIRALQDALKAIEE